MMKMVVGASHWRLDMRLGINLIWTVQAPPLLLNARAVSEGSRPLRTGFVFSSS